MSVLFWAILFFIGAVISAILGFGGYLGGINKDVAISAFGIFLVASGIVLMAYLRGRKKQ